MRPLDKKLLRDLWRLRGQGLAIALVMASGLAVIIMAIGVHRSLYQIRAAYYERYRFGHVFAHAKRVPLNLKRRLAAIDGVSAAMVRITGGIILDIEGMSSPASGRLVSLPISPSGDGQPVLNRLHLRMGRLPASGARGEVVINEAFALAHSFRPGMSLDVIINGRRRRVNIVGVALTPEFIYATSPGEIMPDDRRFGILWMARKEAEAAFDMEGAFNDVVLALRPGASEKEVIARLDGLLAPYGGLGAYGRKDHQSHAFLDAELKQLKGMARVLPPVFLLVAVFLINMTLARITALEREQIGLLKALGYSSWEVAWHYLKLVLVIALIGIMIGLPLGIWFGRVVTRVYTDFYHFPFLIFVNPPDVFAIGIGISLLAAMAGAGRSVMAVARLPPAVAMSPPAPTLYNRARGEFLLRHLPRRAVMIMRHILRFPLRAFITALGIAGGVALLTGALSIIDSINFMIDVTYFRTLLYDASVQFTGPRNYRTALEIARLPGVLRAEPVRSVPIIMRHGHKSRRLSLTGLPKDNRLRSLLDPDLNPLRLPEHGVAIAEKLAELLDLHPGDYVRIESMEGRKRVFRLPVSAIMQGYLGLSVYMDLDLLNELMGDGRVINGVSLMIDEKHQRELFARLKQSPALAGLTMLRISEKKFRNTMSKNIRIIRAVYVIMAMLISFGVVYNAARINLSERGRELASLRVLGFTRSEVSFILLGELALLVLLAIPPGWLLGLGLKWMIVQSLDNELFRVPFHIERDKFFMAAAFCILAASASALAVRKRIDELDLIEVLKTRE